MNSITLEQAQKMVRRAYNKFDEERIIRDKVCNIMVDYDGKRLTRRILKHLEPALEGYSVTYYSERDYQRIKIRDTTEFYEIILMNGPETENFSYERFYEREKSTPFAIALSVLKPYMEDETRLAVFLEGVQDFSFVLTGFKSFISEHAAVWSIISDSFQDVKKAVRGVA